MLTALALIMFAGNSLLCRVALNSHSIDAVSFSAVRIMAGAVILQLILAMNAGKSRVKIRPRNWVSAGMLFLYAICFSLAYVDIPVGVGAMILFGSMQVTMLIAALRSGERLQLVTWTGHAVAIAGFVCLVYPGLSAPPILSSGLMAAAGAAWGIYSVRGKEAGSDPLNDTAENFLYAAPMAMVAWWLMGQRIEITWAGLVIAVISGGLGSGVGYIVWYAALKGLSASMAAMLQMLVPLLVAAGGVLFLGEAVGAHVALAGLLILFGLGMVCRAEPLQDAASRAFQAIRVSLFLPQKRDSYNVAQVKGESWIASTAQISRNH